MLGALAWSPRPGAAQLPGVVSVDLVAMAGPAAAPAAARAGRAAPPPAPGKPRTAEAPTAVPKPAPPSSAPPSSAPPKPEPPKPEPPRREAALPKTPAPPEPRKPRERAQADPKPEPKKPEPKKPEPRASEPARAAAPPAAKPPAPAKPPARQEEGYDDVLAQLRAERGESRPERVAGAPSAGLAGATGVAGSAARGAGQPISADVAVWLRAAKFHVESAWIVPPGFQREALRTVVSVRLDAGGRVLGPPRVTERSANPWYDESVVRAIQKASPLPPPPEPGEWRFEFTPPGSAG